MSSNSGNSGSNISAAVDSVQPATAAAATRTAAATAAAANHHPGKASSIPTATPPPPLPTSNGPSMMVRGFRRIAGGMKTSLALVGVASVAGAYLEYQSHNQEKLNAETNSNAAEKQKRQVLHIPFHRLQLVEKKDSSFRATMNRVLQTNKDDSDRVLPIEVRELVDVLHHAASDPNIVALFGEFGNGGDSLIRQAGWADLEEIRNALKVFREAHRRHAAPNTSHQQMVIPKVQPKPLYAYADTFASLGDPANKEYYLASICSHIHLQNTAGELNLLGVLLQQFFLRRTLETYGMDLHVFKHGKYKNAPNMFTETGFTVPHYENVKNLVDALDHSICRDIASARSQALLTKWLNGNTNNNNNSAMDDQTLWKRIHESGSFPAHTAWKAGLVDYLPRRNPLGDLIRHNNNHQSAADAADKDHDDPDAVKKEWQVQEVDFDSFTADAVVGLDAYARQVRKSTQAAKNSGNPKGFWETYVENSQGFGSFLKKTGLVPSGDSSDNADNKDETTGESIALLRVNENIMDSTARKLVRSIRKIAQDKQTKAVVLRVNSPGGSITACETISQELQALKIPVVVSFGNVSASGGYYISSYADRIFASNKTITGSVGVFGVRLDLTGLAAQWGVNVEHVASGDLAAALDPFHPMTRKMKDNFGQSIDRYYKQFKSIVSRGRSLTLDEVEAVAQGRVWTGEQAKANGLVDEIGGLQRALAYAQREHTESGQALVQEWPKETSVWDRLGQLRNAADAQAMVAEVWASLVGVHESGGDVVYQPGLMPGTDLVARLLNGGGKNHSFPPSMAGVLLAADENAAVQMLLQSNNNDDQQKSPPLLPPNFWD